MLSFRYPPLKQHHWHSATAPLITHLCPLCHCRSIFLRSAHFTLGASSRDANDGDKSFLLFDMIPTRPEDVWSWQQLAISVAEFVYREAYRPLRSVSFHLRNSDIYFVLRKLYVTKNRRQISYIRSDADLWPTDL